MENISWTENVTDGLNRTGRDSNITNITVEQPYWTVWLPTTICAIGMMLNIFNAIVLTRKELQESPFIYFRALAFSDLSLLTIGFIQLTTSHMESVTYTFGHSVFLAYIFFPIGNIFFTTSVWLVVVLTVERVAFVLRPMHFRPSKRKTRICICAVVFFCVILNSPSFFVYQLFEYKKGIYYLKGTEFRNTAAFYHLSWAYSVLVNFIPNLILIVTNTILIYVLHKARKERQSLRSTREEATQRDQMRLTRTLVAIVIMFFICVIPSAFSGDPIAYALFGGNKSFIEYIASPANQQFINISNLLIYLNSSLNFVLYSAFNKKYRIAEKHLLLKLKAKFIRLTVLCRRSINDDEASYSQVNSQTLSTKV